MINEECTHLIRELIQQDWQFMLTWTDLDKKGTWYWEADFSRQLPNGRYDNHESGFDDCNPNIAIKQAYQNIKDGKRLKP